MLDIIKQNYFVLYFLLTLGRQLRISSLITDETKGVVKTKLIFFSTLYLVNSIFLSHCLMICGISLVPYSLIVSQINRLHKDFCMVGRSSASLSALPLCDV